MSPTLGFAAASSVFSAGLNTIFPATNVVSEAAAGAVVLLMRGPLTQLQQIPAMMMRSMFFSKKISELFRKKHLPDGEYITRKRFLSIRDVFLSCFVLHL